MSEKGQFIVLFIGDQTLLHRHLGSQLAEMERLIDKMLQADFSKYTSLELHRPVTDKVLLTDEVTSFFCSNRHMYFLLHSAVRPV